MGRRTGSRNVGYFFRKGRGWFIQINGRMIALRDATVEPLRSRSTPASEIKAARKREHDRIIAGSNGAVNGSTVTVEEVSTSYLDKAKESRGENKTYTNRRRSLYDFCYGFPPRFLDSDEKPNPSDRIHKASRIGRPKLFIQRWLFHSHEEPLLGCAVGKVNERRSCVSR
jgi:hypothetical protein